MLLSHRVLSSFETVEHQLTEVRVPDLARDLEVSLLLAVGEEQVSRSLIGTQVHVLALLDEPLGAEDERATVAPGLQPVWGEPVAAEVPVAPVFVTRLASPKSSSPGYWGWA